MFVNKGELFGHWDCEWQYPWEELLEPPRYTSKGIQVLLKVRGQSCVALFCYRETLLLVNMKILHANCQLYHFQPPNWSPDYEDLDFDSESDEVYF